MSISHLEAALMHAGISEEDACLASELVPQDAMAVILYGSRARGDSIESSDVDLLAMVIEAQGSRARGSISLSCYTPEQLRSASGTLFGMHLARDGVVLDDPSCRATEIISAFDEPDPKAVLARVRHLSAVLDVGNTDEEEYTYGLIRLGRYLLRTATYCESIRRGQPSFSVRELADRFSDSSLIDLLASNPLSIETATRDEIDEIRSRLSVLTGRLPMNPHGSIAALAVNEWESDRDRATIAVLAMAGEKAVFDYPSLPKVLL